MIYTHSRRSVIVASAALALGLHPLAAKKKKRRKGFAPKADAILTTLCQHHIHGERDETPDIAALLARIDAGETIETRCGFIAQVSVMALERAGIAARLVGVVTRGELTGVSDGHTLLEAREKGRWTAYDPTFNRAAPYGVGVVAQCAGPMRWRTLTHDDLCHTQCDIILDPGFDARDFGIPAIWQGIGYVFHDDDFRDRMEGLGYVYVDAAAWRALL